MNYECRKFRNRPMPFHRTEFTPSSNYRDETNSIFKMILDVQIWWIMQITKKMPIHKHNSHTVWIWSLLQENNLIFRILRQRIIVDNRIWVELRISIKIRDVAHSLLVGQREWPHAAAFHSNEARLVVIEMASDCPEVVVILIKILCRRLLDCESTHPLINIFTHIQVSRFSIIRNTVIDNSVLPVWK